MQTPEGFFVIYQPKYTVPSVFDLNERGTFSDRPSVTGAWGFRVLADTDSNTRIQFAHLVHRPGKDPQTGKPYNWTVEEVLLDLDDLLKPDGNAWRNEDEIWQCWIGFAGSESEACRICRTMDAVFRDLQLEVVD